VIPKNSSTRARASRLRSRRFAIIFLGIPKHALFHERGGWIMSVRKRGREPNRGIDSTKCIIRRGQSRDSVAILLRFCSRFWLRFRTPRTAILRDSAESPRIVLDPRISSGADSRAILLRFWTRFSSSSMSSQAFQLASNRAKAVLKSPSSSPTTTVTTVQSAIQRPN